LKGENPGLLKEFKFLILPNIDYKFEITMNDSGESIYSLYNSNDLTLIETQIVQHLNLCIDNYYEGISIYLLIYLIFNIYLSIYL
jgi:hypothetical protein